MEKLSQIRRICAVSLLLFLFGLAMPVSQAMDTDYVYNKNNDRVFEIRFFDATDAKPFDEQQADGYSKFSLTPDQRDAVKRALSYWAERLSGSAAPLETIIINVGGIHEKNAYCGPNNLEETLIGGGVVYVTGGMEKTLVEKEKIDPANGSSHARISIGDGFDYTYAPNSQLQEQPGVSLESVIIHEVGHGLGILQYNPPGLVGKWTTLCDEFDGKGYLVGQQAASVYGDSDWSAANSPKPVPLSTENGAIDLGHFDLRNALFTHKFFRNYTHFMEVELAGLQDLGYDIDRRNFYGKSVYQDNQTLVNYDGFFDRQNGRSLPNTYNQSSYGVGLHIYANNIDLTQKNHLLSAGYAGLGIRSDGVANSIVIDKNVSVHANGELGTGLLVAYGHGSRVANRGDLQAVGTGGIAARFDIGNNTLGRDLLSEHVSDYFTTYNFDTTIIDTEYSYFDRDVPTTTDGGETLSPDLVARMQGVFSSYYAAARAALGGALVDAFDVTGSIKGTQAAIYASSNAHVKQINIMGGATIEGDIITDYDNAGRGNALPTLLTFGKLADNRGFATSTADDAFSFTINSRILGDGTGLNQFEGKGIFDLQFVGGRTTIGSAADIHARNAFVSGGALALTTGQYVNLSGDFGVGAKGALSFTDSAGATAGINQLGTASINGLVEIGADNTLDFAGETIFQPGSALSLEVSDKATVGKVQAQRDLEVAGPTELLLQGQAAAQGFTDQQLLQANNLSGDHNIYSNFFALTQTGIGRFSASMLSFPSI